MVFKRVFRYPWGAAAALLFFVLPFSTSAQVIDNFEQGTFNLMGTSFASGVQISLAPINCITTERVDRMFINGNPSGADLTLGNPDDEVTTVWGNGGGRLEFDYDIGATAGSAVDLSYGGTKNALRVNLTVAVPAGRVEITLIDSAGGSGALASRQIAGAMAYSIPLTEFAAIDVGDVTFIQLALDVPDFGDYHISDFRAWEDPALAAGMDVSNSPVFGPPYPTSAIQIVMHTQDASGAQVQTEMVALSLQNVTNAGTIPDVEMMAADSGGGIGVPGEQVGIIIIEGMPQMKSEQPHFRTMDGLRFDFQGSDEFSSEMHFPPTFLPADDGMSMQLMFKTYSRDRNGVAQFRTEYMIGFEPPEELGLSFSNAFVKSYGIEPQPFFELSFDVDMPDASSKAPGDPIVLMLMNAAVYPLGTAPTPAPHFTGNESLALWAQPSVMSASTQLWMSRAQESDVQLRLFDLAGRAVQTVTIPAGREFAVWDGRDAHGVAVSSGTYFLRAMNAPDASVAKIVKLH